MAEVASRPSSPHAQDASGTLRPDRPRRKMAVIAGGVLLYLAAVVVIALGAAAGIWVTPFVAAFAVALVLRQRARVVAPALALAAAAGWGIPLAWQAGQGLPVGATARAVAALAGLPASAALVIIITLLVAALQALAGTWLARAIRSGPQPELGLSAADDGFRSFLTLWAGQFASLVGSAIASFALGVRIFQLTDSAVQLGVVFACGLVPVIVVSPVTGALADRWGRRRALIISNGGYMVTMLALALLLITKTFAVWQVYPITIINSSLSALQVPAFGSAIPLLVRKQQIGRANGRMMLATATAQVFAPVAAGFLLLLVRLQGIVLIDLVSFAAALITVLMVRIPQPHMAGDSGEEQPATLLGAFAEAWRYVVARRGLVHLLVLFGVLCFLCGFVDVLYIPLVLGFASTGAVGTVLTVGGLGMVVGGLAMSVWGGRKRRTRAMLGFTLVLGISVIIGAMRPSVALVAVGAFFFLGSTALVDSNFRTIWQVKVEPRLQGRVLALQNMVGTSPQVISYLLAGVIGGDVLVPLVGRSHVRSGFLAAIIGNGAGRGYALTLLIVGLLIIVTAAGSWLDPRLRRVEDELPDAVNDSPAPVASSRRVIPNPDRRGVSG
jgi:MFS transporter, DHA3 family, macrolide efflux protein